MRVLLFCSLVFFLSMAACQNFPPQEKPAQSSKSLEHKEWQEDVKIKPSSGKPSTFTHVVVSETPYYVDGPQQGRAPEGYFRVGTKLKVLEQQGSYSIVESSEGIRAWVADNALKKF